MVDYRKAFSRLTNYSNDKQNLYLANVSGVSGGAVMYTAWQIIVAEELSNISIVKAIMMLVFSVVLVSTGYKFLGGPNREA